jgi:restriction system protein
LAAAAGIFMLAKAMLPEAYAPYGMFASLPFFVIGCVTGWRQLRTPSAERVAATLESLRALSWDEFSAALEQAFQRDGYAVTRLGGAAADFKLSKAGRVSLVACKRWKATRTGVEPLKELDAAKQASEAGEGIYVAAGGITDNARAFAAEKGIRLLHDAELASLLPRPKRVEG